MKFTYQARTEQGKIKQGIVEASNFEVARETLREHKLIVISIKPAEKGLNIRLRFLERVKTKEVVVFTRQLSILLEAKVPLVQSLKTLVKQVRSRIFQEKISQIAIDVEAGLSLSDALNKHAQVFSSLYINMIKSGELSGNLDKSLNYLADHLEKEQDLRSKIRGAMFYPAFILVGLLAVGAAMITFVIPQLTAILKETGQELPLQTKVLIVISDFLRDYWWVLLLGLVAVLIILRYYIKTNVGRWQWDWLKLKLPLFGNLFRKISLTRFADNLSVLTTGGIPIIRSLEVTSDVVGNVIFKDLFIEASEKVKVGQTISSVLEKSNYVPAIVAQMISIGEKTGKLETVLKNLARLYSRETENMVNNLTVLIEPILIIIMGLAVGFLVAAILMPIYNIAGGI